jgi:Rrf2 family protein
MEHIPLQFLRHILRKLAVHGLIQAKEGVTGGFTLARAPEKIKVTDVIALFQGPVSFTECAVRSHPCIHRSSCPLRRQLGQIEKMVISTFNGITIASLLIEAERNG